MQNTQNEIDSKKSILEWIFDCTFVYTPITLVIVSFIILQHGGCSGGGFSGATSCNMQGFLSYFNGFSETILNYSFALFLFSPIFLIVYVIFFIKKILKLEKVGIRYFMLNNKIDSIGLSFLPLIILILLYYFL